MFFHKVQCAVIAWFCRKKFRRKAANPQTLRRKIKHNFTDYPPSC